MKKGQASIEFVILTAFMILFFIIFTIGIQNRLYVAHVHENEVIAKELASVINNEAVLADPVHAGFSRSLFGLCLLMGLIIL